MMSDIYYGYSARLMAQLARAIGRTAEGEEYERLFGHIKQAFIAKYLSTEGGTVTSCRLTNCMPWNSATAESTSSMVA